MKRTTFISFIVAVIMSVSLAGSQIVLAQEEKPLPPGVKKQGEIPGKGSHKGWEQGKHKGWFKKGSDAEAESKKDKSLKGEKEHTPGLKNEEKGKKWDDAQAEKSHKRGEPEVEQGEGMHHKGKNK